MYVCRSWHLSVKKCKLNIVMELQNLLHLVTSNHTSPDDRTVVRNSEHIAETDDPTILGILYKFQIAQVNIKLTKVGSCKRDQPCYHNVRKNSGWGRTRLVDCTSSKRNGSALESVMLAEAFMEKVYVG